MSVSVCPPNILMNFSMTPAEHVSYFLAISVTPPKTNECPLKIQWLEDYSCPLNMFFEFLPRLLVRFPGRRVFFLGLSVHLDVHGS